MMMISMISIILMLMILAQTRNNGSELSAGACASGAIHIHTQSLNQTVRGIVDSFVPRSESPGHAACCTDCMTRPCIANLRPPGFI